MERANPNSEMKSKNDFINNKNNKNYFSEMESLDSIKCVVCYENKASCFCDGCQASSGVCWTCHHEIKNKAFGFGNFRIPAPCVICKKPMNRATMNGILETKLELGDRLDTVYQVSIPKTERLAEIIYKTFE
jgi:hypothetical protein